MLINGGSCSSVSSTDGDGIKAFRQTLLRTAKSLPWFEEALPGSFVKLKSKLAHMALMEGRKIVTVEEMFDLADDCGIIFENHEVVISLLHDLGVIKHFSPPVRHIPKPWTHLQDTIYINVPWLIDAIKGIVRHDRNSMFRYFNQAIPLLHSRPWTL